MFRPYFLCARGYLYVCDVVFLISAMLLSKHSLHNADLDLGSAPSPAQVAVMGVRELRSALASRGIYIRGTSKNMLCCSRR